MVDDLKHYAFDKVLKLAMARRNILLIGPAGCGKTHLAEKIAEALGVPFGLICCSAGTDEHHLLGRYLPVALSAEQVMERFKTFLALGLPEPAASRLASSNGDSRYLVAEFVRLYEGGGVFLLDELDAADANVMLVINSALANGYLALPNRPRDPVARRHPDFICVASANTYGKGADRQYVGRTQLDEATLDRFRIGQVELDYDPRLEEHLCPDPELRGRLQRYRKRARQARVLRIISTRFLQDANIMKQSGFTDADIDQALFAGWTADEVTEVTAVTAVSEIREYESYPPQLVQRLEP